MSEADTRYEDALTDARRDGVIWLAYGNAGRHLIRLAAPAVLVFLPVNLLTLLGLALVVDESAALVNGSFELLGTPGRPLLVWAAAAILITLAGQLVVIPFCVTLACNDPWTKELARLPSRTSDYQDHGLVVAADPLSRPVVLRFDEHAGSLTLITCEEVGCDDVHVERLVQGGWTWGFEDVRGRAGATMLVRDDGRPLIAYRDSADGSIRMLDCRNLRCSQSDSVILAGPGRYRVPPALVVDEGGRALVAYQDIGSNRIVVATCTGTRCVHTPVAKSRYMLGDVLAMTLDAHGRPAIGWVDRSGDDWDLIVTTPLNLPS